MSNWIRNTFVLGLVCFVAAVGVGGTYLLTIPKIRARDEARTQDALKAVLPGAQSLRSVGEDKSLFAGYNGDALVGYAAIGAAQGYSSKVKVVVGAKKDGDALRVIAIKVIHQQETPGLGARVDEIKSNKTIWTVLFGGGKEPEKAAAPLEPWFQEQFKGKLADQVKLKKVGGNIDAITGATITSTAVVNAVQAALSHIAETVEQSGAKRK